MSGQKKINISVAVFFWKYDVKTRCKNFISYLYSKRNNVMVIDKKSLLLARIKNCVENPLKSVFSMADKYSIQGGKSVSIYSAASFWKITLSSIKSHQKNGRKRCSFMHFNCYARQFTHTKSNFCRGTDIYRQQNIFRHRAIIKKSTFCFQSGAEIHDVCSRKGRHFLTKT